MATDAELVHLKRLKETVKGVADELEIQIASYGGERRAPVDLVLEYKAHQESIKRIDSRMIAITVPQAVQDATGPEASIDVLRGTVKSLSDQLYTAMREFSAQQLAGREEAREWRTKQDAERKQGWRRYRFAGVALGAGVAMALYRTGGTDLLMAWAAAVATLAVIVYLGRYL